MKKLIIAAGLLMATSAYAQTEVLTGVTRGKDYGVVYSLPKTQIELEIKANKVIYPPNALIFNAFNTTPLANVKVVILGQDPYHGPNQAHGLSFSVQKGLALPPSLRNIFHELNKDLGIDIPKHGDLTRWAQQGVLLLNSVLTVEAGQPTSHQKQGWEDFTDHVIDVLNEQREHIVFILWGAYAQRKGQRIDQEKHLVLKAAHPSPLAANRGGFFGCKVVSYLIQSA
jgi:uracil-DNA glycosylase